MGGAALHQATQMVLAKGRALAAHLSARALKAPNAIASACRSRRSASSRPTRAPSRAATGMAAPARRSAAICAKLVSWPWPFDWVPSVTPSPLR
jgi:hypothetical protein